MKSQAKIKVDRSFEYVFTYGLILFSGFVFFFPVLWLMLASFSAQGSIYDFEGVLPQRFSFATFGKLFQDIDMYNYPKWFLNTLFVATMSCVIGTVLVILTAYTFHRFKFKSRKNFIKTTLVLGMFPSFMGMIAVYLLMVQFGLINNLWGLILIYSAGAPMGYGAERFLDTIPYAIDEAGTIDGANKLQIFIHITLPLAKPMIVYTSLASFTWLWSDFILPKLLLKQKNLYTVAVGLMSLGEDEFARFAAGS